MFSQRGRLRCIRMVCDVRASTARKHDTTTGALIPNVTTFAIVGKVVYTISTECTKWLCMDFFHRKTRTAWSYLFLGFVGVGVLASLLILTASFTRVSSGRRLVGETAAPLPASAADVIVQYREGLVAAQAAVTTAANTTMVFSQAEETLFTLRVPRELLEDHFQAVLTVRRLREEGAARSLLETQAEVTEILHQLEIRAQALETT